jgi:hypothetical protein
MDPVEYGRLAYVHHRAKASAYASAGDEARAHGHARAAERHRAAAFGDVAGTVAGAVAGIAAVGLVGAGVIAQRLRLKLKQREARALREKASVLRAEADEAAARLWKLQEPKRMNDAKREEERRARERAEKEAERAALENGARAALDAWYASAKGGAPSRGDGAAFALENRAGFTVDHGGYTFRVVATTVDGDRDVFNADRGRNHSEYVKEQVPAVALVATRTADGAGVTLGKRRTD